MLYVKQPIETSTRPERKSIYIATSMLFSLILLFQLGSLNKRILNADILSHGS